MASSAAPKSDVLNSWKEIASYLGRGVRTVQRWEHDLAMPVRRPRAKSRSAVIALPAELDAWLRTAPQHELEAPLKPSAPQAGHAADLSTAERLRRQCHELREHHRALMVNLMESLETLQNSMKASRESENLQLPSKPRTIV